MPSRTVWRLYIWCLLGLVERVSLVTQGPDVRRWGNAVAHHLLQKSMGFTILPTSGCHLCGRSSLPPHFLLLAAACSHPSPALLPAPAMLPLGNTPKLQKAEDNMIYESLHSTDSWRNPHSLFIHRQLQQRQNRLNTCRLRKTAQPHFRRSLQ